MKMTNSNKITNTKVGDDIHFYVNGSEDRGIVVKMNNDYVTVFKESTQEYDNIHINDTFFIKDILVNKEWDKMEDDERFEALKKIHAPSPRFIMKRWNDLPKEIKELLTKNNAIETSHKEGKDDDMNNLTRLSGTVDENKSGDGSWRSHSTGDKGKKIPKGQVGSKPKGGEAKPDGAIDAGGKAHGETYTKNPEAITEHQAPERFRSIDNEPKQEKGTKDTTTNFMTEGGGGIGVFEESPLGSGAAADNARQAKIQGRAAQGTKETDKKVSRGTKKLKAWQLWLAKREQEVLKDSVTGKQSKEGKPESGHHDLRTTDPKSTLSNFQWHKSDVANRSDSKVLRTDQPERTAEGKPSKKPYNYGEDDSERVGMADTADNRPSDKYNAGRKVKAWEQWLTEQKSNTERSIHGNAGREPNSGVNTNTGFDAPKDYEGFSHSGVRPEQFKHERKKPKVTNKERINIGSTSPSNPSQGTGDGGNPHNTRQQNKDVKGRAVSGKDRK